MTEYTIMHEIADFCVEHAVDRYVVLIAAETDFMAAHLRLEAQRLLDPDVADAIMITADSGRDF